MRIVHIADVHWRSLQRHDEYRKSFSDAFEKFKKLKPDVIVVCGDIYESKTMGISPELIEQLVWWFNAMADICSVHAILGNHDGNLANQQRQDTISPIISAIGRDNIFLYKKSGVYPFAPGFNWCVFSLFDEDGWKNVKPVPGDVNIALFHGTVMSSMTDQGFELESEMTTDFFKEYDFTLLGDIHAQQYLAYRDVEIVIDEADLKKYPGAEIIEVI